MRRRLPRNSIMLRVFGSFCSERSSAMEKSSLFMSFLIYLFLLRESLSLPAANVPSNRWETNQDHQSKDTSHSKDAYATLLYGGDFLLGVRVLGQSLRDTGTKKDLVALCTEAVSATDREILKSDGWIIDSVMTVESPYEGLSRRGDYFNGVFTKLLIWNMTKYERVVYLDADVIAVANIDHMFDCGTFCAAYRHSDLFNSGVLVIQPSRTTLEDMLEKVPKLTSYDDGEQGFLNVYFRDLVYASMFNWSNPTRQKIPQRMSGRLNADMGLYYAYSRWDVPEMEVRVIHYTLGPVKPWKWWSLSSGLFDLCWIWQDVRKRLPKYALYKDYYVWWNPIFWGPFPIILVLFISLKLFSRYFQAVCRRSFIAKVFAFLGRYYKIITTTLPVMTLLLSYFLSFAIVPEAIKPRLAEYVFWLWSNFFFILFTSILCQLYNVSAGTTDVSSSRVSPSTRVQILAYYIMYLFSYLLL